jgi:hypothetical protein
VGCVEIREKDGALTILLGRQTWASPRQHWDRDTLLYEPSPELAGAFAGVTFVLGPDRKARPVLLPDSFEGEAWVFTRLPPEK